MFYKFLVTEIYPDGGKWRHYFRTVDEAETTIELLKEAHPIRKFELKELSE